MKRLFKYALVAVISLILLMSFCSCDLIDELKESRVDILDEDEGVLEYKGNKYIKLDNERGCKINEDDAVGCDVVKKDVPLLLISPFGMRGRYSARKDIIIYTGQYYCTLDKHEAYQKILDEGVTDCYSCVRYFIDYEKMDIESEIYIFPEELTELIKDTMKNKVGREIDASRFKELDHVYIDNCDSEGLIFNVRTVNLYLDDNNKTCGLAFYGGEDVYIIREMPEGTYEKYVKLFKQFDYHNVWEEFYGIKIGDIAPGTPLPT